MTKIIVNNSYEDDEDPSFSPAAMIWLYNNGCQEIVLVPVDEYCILPNHLARDLETWKRYNANPKMSGKITVFTPDEKYVICFLDEIKDDGKPIYTHYHNNIRS